MSKFHGNLFGSYIDRGLGHLRQRLNDLILRAIEILEFVNVKVF